MAVDIKVRNLLTENAQNTSLSTNLSVGGTVVPVKNINSFSPSDAIQLGQTGEEQSEILLVDAGAVSGTALNTVGTVRFSHPIDTPAYKEIIFVLCNGCVKVYCLYSVFPSWGYLIDKLPLCL